LSETIKKEYSSFLKGGGDLPQLQAPQQLDSFATPDLPDELDH
jgi:hypothetical protein